MANAAIEIPRQELVELCRRNHTRRLSLFGSVLRDNFGPDSDIDVLVEFEEGHVPGLRFFALQRELSELLRRAVDLHTPSFLSPHFRSEVLAEAEIQYDGLSGQPVAQLAPLSTCAVGDWSGAMSGTGKILGDLVAPTREQPE